MNGPPEYTSFELFEPRLKSLLPEMREEFAPIVKASFEATEQIQRMHNHLLYRIGAWCYDKTGTGIHFGEILYEGCWRANKFWRIATFRE